MMPQHMLVMEDIQHRRTQRQAEGDTVAAMMASCQHHSSAGAEHGDRCALPDPAQCENEKQWTAEREDAQHHNGSRLRGSIDIATNRLLPVADDHSNDDDDHASSSSAATTDGAAKRYMVAVRRRQASRQNRNAGAVPTSMSMPHRAFAMRSFMRWIASLWIIVAVRQCNAQTDVDVNVNQTEVDTDTAQPTLTPTTQATRPAATRMPTLVPSGLPTTGPTSNPTVATELPTQQPTVRPTLFPTVSMVPSVEPSASAAPSVSPSFSAKPSTSPTTTTQPSSSPSFNPTLSFEPSDVPSALPSSPPSLMPSETPTIQPTFESLSVASEQFRQKFTIGNGRILDTVEIAAFQKLYEEYTQQFAPLNIPVDDQDPSDPDQDAIASGITIIGRTTITCNVDNQVGLSRRRRHRRNLLRSRSSSSSSSSHASNDEDTETSYDGSDNDYDIDHDDMVRQQIIDININNNEYPPTDRQLQSQVFLSIELDFTMSYASLHVDVTEFPFLFQTFIRDNRVLVARDLQELGLNITEAESVSRLIVNPDPTSAPTESLPPTELPSELPTLSFKPSPTPSEVPTIAPTAMPTRMPVEETAPPTRTESNPPSAATEAPVSTEPPTADSSGGGPSFNANTIIVVVAVVVGALLLVGLFICYRRRKHRREQRFQTNAANGNLNEKKRPPKEGDTPPVPQQPPSNWNHARQQHGSYHPNNLYGNNNNRRNGDPAYPVRPGPVSLYGANEDDYFPPTTMGQENNNNAMMMSRNMNNPGIISPSESLISNQSLLSAGEAMTADSGDEEADATHHLADEFDQYKDQNLEKMRAEVEGNLTGFDGMMSQALTKALIDDHDDDAHYFGTAATPTTLTSTGSLTDSLWGGSLLPGAENQGQQLSGIEIEASVLGEVTDWLRREENATNDERYAFMQSTLNKMVASVRHAMLGPDDAARAIHESGALLGFQLATELTVTTLIVTGMRKTATAEIMVRSFQQFGDIAEAAVSPNGKGCGIIRFKNSKSADAAMRQFRSTEIVVQDVGVQLKLLKPDRQV